MITTILTFVFFQCSLLIPSYALIVNLRWFRDKPALELCAAYVVSILVFGLFALGGYIFHWPLIVISALHWVLLLAGTAVFIWQKLYKRLQTHVFPLAAFLAMSLFSCMVVNLTFSPPLTIIPDPQPSPNAHYDTLNIKVLNIAQTAANDNYVPYRQAQFIVNRSDPGHDSFIDEWGVHFFQRTPLMGAVTAEYFTLLQEKPPIDYTWSNTSQDPSSTYLQFQVISQILNSLFIIPAYFLISYLFTRKAAQIALLFIIPSHFFLYNAIFSWPKSLVAFFVLFSWMLIFEQKFRYLVLAGVASGAAYLTHDLAVLYIGASVILLLYYKRLRHILAFLALNALFAIPWLFTAAVLFKKPSSFIYYPFSMYGIPQPEQKDVIMQQFWDASPLKLLYIRVQSFFYLLSPYQLIIDEGGQTFARRMWAESLFNIPGAVGLGLIFASIGGALKKIANIPFWILAITPIILCTIIIGWPNGLGALHFAEASVVLFIGLGTWFLTTRKHIVWAGLAFLANIAQLVWFVLYSFQFDVKAWFANPRDVFALIIISATIVGCGWLMIRIMRGGTKTAISRG